jgi:hypothetical protein
VKNPFKAMKTWTSTPIGEVGGGIYDVSPPLAYFAKGMSFATAPIVGIAALFQKSDPKPV